jgi:predicted Zn finger-like uncharacterized protein
LIVRCENCQTEFSLDDSQVAPGGATVRCSVCAFVFRVEPDADGTQGWQVRTADDMLFTAPDMKTMVQWIEEGRLHPDDEVSKTGRNWLRIGDMGEFAPLFGEGEPVIKAVKMEPSGAEELGPPPPFATTPSTPEPTPAPAPITHEPPAGPARPSLVIDDEPSPAPAESQPKRPEPEPAKPTPKAEPEKAQPARTEPPKPAPARAAPVAADPLPEPAPQGGIGKVVALVAVLAGVGVMFGVPSIRQKLMNLGGEPAAAPAPAPQPSATSRAEFGAAASAKRNLGVSEMAAAEARLQGAIDRGAADAGALRLAQVDLLSARALAYEMASVLDTARHDDLISKARADADAASKLLERLGDDVPRSDETARVRAQLRLATGADPVEVAAMSADPNSEPSSLALAAPLWRDETAALPPAVLSKLRAFGRSDGPIGAALLVALDRSGDEEGAVALAQTLIRGASDHPVAVAMLAKAGVEPQLAGTTTAEAADGGAESSGEPGPEDDGGADLQMDNDSGDPTTGEAPSDPTPAPSTETKKKKSVSTSSLISRGCRAVEGPDAKQGVALLLKAFDREPNNVDVLVCLGKGYEKTGQGSAALQFLDRALARSPKNRPALRAAAALHAKRGNTAKAVKYYERLLQSTDDPTARAYVAKHGVGGGGSTSGGTPAPSPAPKPAPGPEPAKPEPAKPEPAKPEPAKPAAPPPSEPAPAGPPSPG